MKNRLPWITTAITCLFLIAIAIDFSPFLRGPAPYSPDWRWPYQIPTISFRILAPFITGGIILTTVFFQLKKSIIKKTWLLFIIFIFLGWIFELSLVFSSNAGISVLIHRMINPMISGYFTTATQITSIQYFLQNFNDSFNFYPLFGRFHPPFDILFYYLINKISIYVTPLIPMINNLSPTHDDVAIIWNSLFAYEKVGAILGVLFTQLGSMLTIIPLFLATKNILNERSGLIAITLYILTPSILLFSPLTDTMYPLFVVTSFYLLTQAIKLKKNIYFCLAGLILSIGALFTLTILPILLLFGVYYLFQTENIFDRRKLILKNGLLISSGFLVPLIFLQVFFQLEIITMVERMMLYHHLTQIGRNYFVWLFYSPYDFLIFLGIPTTILFLTSLRSKFWSRENGLTISFIILILTLDLLGSVKGETGRVWIPYVIFPIIIAASSLAKMKLQEVMLFLLLLAIHSLVFNFFLVTLW